MKKLTIIIISLLVGFTVSFTTIRLIRNSNQKPVTYTVTKEQVSILMEAAYLQGYQNSINKVHRDSGWNKIKQNIDKNLK